MPIKLKFERELSVDLNAYYPQFPKALRELIDEAVWGLASGVKKETARPREQGLRDWSKVSDGHNLTFSARTCRMTNAKPPQRGALLKAWQDLHNTYDTREGTMGGFKATLIATGSAHPVSNISRLWALGCIEVSPC